MKFKNGDRVKYFGNYNDLLEISKATILEICQNGLVRIRLDHSAEGFPVEQYAHPFQLREFRKKRVFRGDWIRSGNQIVFLPNVPREELTGLIEQGPAKMCQTAIGKK